MSPSLRGTGMPQSSSTLSSDQSWKCLGVSFTDNKAKKEITVCPIMSAVLQAVEAVLERIRAGGLWKMAVI